MKLGLHKIQLGMAAMLWGRFIIFTYPIAPELTALVSRIEFCYFLRLSARIFLGPFTAVQDVTIHASKIKNGTRCSICIPQV